MKDFRLYQVRDNVRKLAGLLQPNAKPIDETNLRQLTVCPKINYSYIDRNDHLTKRPLWTHVEVISAVIIAVSHLKEMRNIRSSNLRSIALRISDWGLKYYE